MKLLTAIILSMVLITEASASTGISSGDAALFSFSNLSGPITCQDSVDPNTGETTICLSHLKGAEIQFSLSPSDTLTGNEQLRVSYFENSTSDVYGAIFIEDYTSSDVIGNVITDSFTGFLPPPYSPEIWGDHQGTFLIEVLNGSVSISKVDVAIWYGGKFEGQATVSTVPLPPTVWLFSSGLLGLAGAAKRKRKLAN